MKRFSVGFIIGVVITVCLLLLGGGAGDHVASPVWVLPLAVFIVLPAVVLNLFGIILSESSFSIYSYYCLWNGFVIGLLFLSSRIWWRSGK